MNDTGFIYGEIPSFIRAYVHFAEKRFKGSKHLVESKNTRFIRREEFAYANMCGYHTFFR